MVTAAYDIGDQRRLQADFTDANETAADPTAITLTILEPDGTEVTKAIGDLTSPQTGRWIYDYTITKPGRHVVRWDATATVITAEDTEFYARRKEGVT
jgi:hypothetical protein